MAEQSKAQELKLREENGDTLAGVVPTDRLITVCPFRVENRIRNPTGDFFYFFPRECLWSVSAQGFGQVKGATIANSMACYQPMIEHIFLLGHTIGEGLEEEGLERQFVTWTVVPCADDERRYAGYLVRSIYQMEISQVFEAISEQIKHCTNNLKAGVALSKRENNLPAYRRFDYSVYINMCNYYWGKEVGLRACGFQNLEDPQNPYNPQRVFSLEVAVKKIQYAGGHKDFCDARNYRSVDDQVVFPREGSVTHLLCASQMNPLALRRTYLPHIPRSKESFETAEFHAFARNAGVPAIAAADQDDDADEVKAMELDDGNSEAENGIQSRVAQLVQAKNSFQLLSATGDSDSANTLLAWKKKCKIRLSEAHREGVGDPRTTALARREGQFDCMRWFSTDILSEDDTADCGDATKGIAKWFWKHLRNNNNFCMPNPKYTNNLSRFGDLQAQEAALGDSIWAIHVAHQEVKSLRLACMHVYFNAPFHAHTCLLGPPGSGKSHAFQINHLRLIEGTSREIGSETHKAKMTPGKKTDLSIETFEDIPPAQVGVSNYTGGGKGSMTSNTDNESFLKYRLTKGRVKSTYKQVVNGVHSLVEIDSFCNTVMLIGMNAILSQIPKSISNRFNNIQFQYRSRLNYGGREEGVVSKFAHAGNPKMQAAQDCILLRDARNQAFHLIIELFCWAGVFDMPDMTVPMLIWTQTLTKAKQKGLHDTTDVRHYERLKFHCETLVVEDAINRVMDSGKLSPLDPKEKFRIEHCIFFEAHLWGNTEHAAFALGLFQHQYENPIVLSVEKFFNTELLKTKIRRREIGKADPNPAVQLENSYYYIIKLDNLSHNGSAYDREKSLQQSEQIQRLQRHIVSRMNPKPQPEEVTYALECLAALQVEVSNKMKRGEMLFIPALAFSRDGEVMIAEHLMQHYTPDRLMSCLRETLSHAYTKQKNFLYGTTTPEHPNIYHTLHIKPNPAKKLVMEQPSYFSECVIQMTHNAVIGVGLSANDPSTRFLSDQELTAHSFRKLFSDSSHKNVDMDLDDWASYRQAEKIGLRNFPPTVDAPNYDTSVDSMQRQILAEAEAEDIKLVSYPRCMEELEPLIYQQNIAKDQADHPEKYSLREMMFGGKRKHREGDEQSEPGDNRSVQQRIDEDDEEGEGYRDREACNADHMCEHNDLEAEEEDDEGQEEGAMPFIIPPPQEMLRLAAGAPQGSDTSFVRQRSADIYGGAPLTNDDWDAAFRSAMAVQAKGPAYHAFPVHVSR